VGKMSVGEAVDVIINDNLSLAHRRDSHRWRYARLYFEEVHMVLSSRMSVLKSVYEVYSNRYAIAGQCGPSCKGAGANTQRVCLPSARRDSVDERAGVVGPS